MSRDIHLTGEESVDQAKFAEAAALKALEEFKKANPDLLPKGEEDAGGQPKPIKVAINGKDVEFKDEMELSTAITQTLAQYQAKLAELEQKTAPKPPKKTDTETFSTEEFAKLVEKNPLDGINYALKYSPVTQELEQLRAWRDQQVQKTAAYEFREISNDFTPEPQNVQALQQAVQSLGLNTANPGHLAAAWAFAKSQGFVRPSETAPRQAAKQPAIVPPALGRNSVEEVPDWAKQAEDLDEAALEKLIAKISSAGR